MAYRSEGAKRGTDDLSGSLFSYLDLETRVPQDHLLRPIRALVDEALAVLSPDFERLYSKTGRPSIAPEKLLRALLLQAFFTMRSERQLMEQLNYNLLFRWFVGLTMDERVWDATVYSKNRDRLIAGNVVARFLQAVLQGERVRGLLSDEHVSVDGTLIEAWASMNSFRPREGATMTRRGAVGATPSATSAASAAPMRPTCRRPTPMPGFIARAGVSRAGSAS